MSAQLAMREEPRGAGATGWWGMVLFILAELALFGTALAAYFFLRYHASTWPPPGVEEPDLALGGAATLLLLLSSLPMLWAERSIGHGHVSRMRMGIVLAMILGLIFLVIQFYEYSIATFSVRTQAYGSLFYAITGLHALHLLAGMLISMWLLIRSFAGHFDADHHEAIQCGALYWHFVDLVWIAIFASLYVSPHLR